MSTRSFVPIHNRTIFGELKYLLPLPGIETSYLCRPVLILITTFKTISGSFCVILSTGLIDMPVFYLVKGKVTPLQVRCGPECG